MQPAIELRRKILSNRPTLGVLVTQHLWLDLIEILLGSGIDYMIIDTEHFDHGSPQIADACRLGRVANFPILLRPSRTDTEAIRIAMDLGPCGFLLPMIEDAAQLDRVRDGIYMPPRGLRRPGGPSNRWLKGFSYEDYRRDVEEHVIVIPQIESLAGMRNAQAIAAHPIVTALGVGPFDLSAQMGLCWKPEHPDLRAAIQHLKETAIAADKPLWMIGEPFQLLQDGHRFLCIGEPSSMLQAALTGITGKLRELAGPETGATHDIRIGYAKGGNGAGTPPVPGAPRQRASGSTEH